MPLTFIDIERRKSRKIAVMFFFLIGLYFVLMLAIFALPGLIIGGLSFNSTSLALVLVSSILLAVVHFWLSASTAVTSVLETTGALEPDKEDDIHLRLINITDEINVASGHQNIRCYVIPTLSMNALAVTDLRGTAAVAITEGLLSRLTRPQLEAVMAHEAYHIVSGDCLETTVAASLFGIHAAALAGMRQVSEEDIRAVPLFALYWLLLKLSQLLNMFVSREREYRADAASIRITRNPVAMAEALDLLSRNWTGTGIISDGFEMLCIINPDVTQTDDREGWTADLFSTHPPIRKRILQLLRLAKVSITAFEKRMESKPTREVSGAGPDPYFALDNKHCWAGPFSYNELVALPWFSAATWVANGNTQNIRKASEVDELSQIFLSRISSADSSASDMTCPSCRQRLFKVSYEGTTVYECRHCGGVLIETGKLPRILARQEVPCTERVVSLARAMIEDNQNKRAIAKLKKERPAYKSGMNCSRCGNPMFRTFYSYAYLIELDRCGVCRLTWFDADELEMLQCIIENKLPPKISLPPS